MKILLIDPPFYRFIGYYNRYFPLGLACLAAVLRQEGHEVLIYDADCNVNPSKIDFISLEDSYPRYLESAKDKNHPLWREAKKVISDFKPDLAGISVWTTFAASSFTLASLCKDYDKHLPVVMGGPHVSIRYEEVMRICPSADFLVRGEGERTLAELARTIAGEGKELKDLAGISYRENGKTIHNPKREFIDDLDCLPFPARDLLLNKASYDSEDMGLLMTSRGCPYGCSYCATSIWERKTRCRSIDNVIAEIKQIIAGHGTRQFAFKDDSFTVSRKRVLEFCDKLIRQNISISWDCNTRVNLIDEELLVKMKKAGCNSIKVGIETGSEKILRLINKKISFEDCRRAAGLFRKVGIHWTGYFMMGLPSETREDILQTLRFMKELDPDYASFSVYEPFPGTELFNIGVEKGLVQPDRSLEDFYAISPKHYYFKDADRRSDTMDNEEFERIEEDMKRQFHKFNRRPRKIFKRVKSRGRSYMVNPLAAWGDFRKFLSWV